MWVPSPRLAPRPWSAPVSRSKPSQAGGAAAEPWYFSHQVSEQRRYFFHVDPPARSRCHVVSCGCERVRADYVIDRKTIPFIIVEFVAEGEGTVVLQGREYRLQPGVAFAYAPQMHHVIRNDPERPMLKYFVCFVGTEAAKLLRSTRLGRWLPLQVPAIEEVVEILELILRAGQRGGEDSQKLCDALVPVLLLKIEEAAQPGGRVKARSDAAFGRVRRHIEKHYLHLRTIEEVAEECGLTPVYVSRLFRRFARVGAHQFLMRLKMNHAAQLLFDDGLMVKEVAEKVGFSDPFHFSRAFKRAYGVAPDRFIHYRVGRGRMIEDGS